MRTLPSDDELPLRTSSSLSSYAIPVVYRMRARVDSYRPDNFGCTVMLNAIFPFGANSSYLKVNAPVSVN